MQGNEAKYKCHTYSLIKYLHFLNLDANKFCLICNDHGIFF